MTRLLACSRIDGWYFYTEDELEVLLFKPPYSATSIEHADSKDVFIRKSFDSDMEFIDKSFESFKSFRDFVIEDSEPSESRFEDILPDFFNDALRYAPDSIVEKDIAIIETRLADIETSDSKLKGAGLLIKQLEKSLVVEENELLRNKLDELEIELEKRIFDSTDKEENVFELKIGVSKRQAVFVCEAA